MSESVTLPPRYLPRIPDLMINDNSSGGVKDVVYIWVGSSSCDGSLRVKEGEASVNGVSRLIAYYTKLISWVVPGDILT